MYCSAQYLAIPYGDSGRASTSSRDGMGASRPYRAPPDDVDLRGLRGCGHRRTDIDLRRKVADQLRPELAGDRRERDRVGNAQLVQRDVLVEASRPACGQVIEHAPLVARAEKRVGEM